MPSSMAHPHYLHHCRGVMNPGEVQIEHDHAGRLAHGTELSDGLRDGAELDVVGVAEQPRDRGAEQRVVLDDADQDSVAAWLWAETATAKPILTRKQRAEIEALPCSGGRGCGVRDRAA